MSKNLEICIKKDKILKKATLLLQCHDYFAAKEEGRERSSVLCDDFWKDLDFESQILSEICAATESLLCEVSSDGDEIRIAWQLPGDAAAGVKEESVRTQVCNYFVARILEGCGWLIGMDGCDGQLLSRPSTVTQSILDKILELLSRTPASVIATTTRPLYPI